MAGRFRCIKVAKIVQCNLLIVLLCTPHLDKIKTRVVDKRNTDARVRVSTPWEDVAGPNEVSLGPRPCSASES